MFKFLLGVIVGGLFVYNVDVDRIIQNVEFEKKQVEISVPTLK